ncbi:MAG: hypothetical protein ACK5X3_13765 [Pseudomonadota bacterium]
MKIREGAYYRTRNGDVAGPMRRTTDQFWYSNYRTWNEDGGIFSSGAAHGLDLISEVYVSDTPPDVAPAPEAKTLRDEFAMRLMDRDAFAVGYKEEAEQLYRAADAMMEARKK